MLNEQQLAIIENLARLILSQKANSFSFFNDDNTREFSDYPEEIAAAYALCNQLGIGTDTQVAPRDKIVMLLELFLSDFDYLPITNDLSLLNESTDFYELKHQATLIEEQLADIIESNYQLDEPNLYAYVYLLVNSRRIAEIIKEKTIELIDQNEVDLNKIVINIKKELHFASGNLNNNCMLIDAFKNGFLHAVKKIICCNAQTLAEYSDHDELEEICQFKIKFLKTLENSKADRNRSSIVRWMSEHDDRILNFSVLCCNYLTWDVVNQTDPKLIQVKQFLKIYQQAINVAAFYSLEDKVALVNFKQNLLDNAFTAVAVFCKDNIKSSADIVCLDGKSQELASAKIVFSGIFDTESPTVSTEQQILYLLKRYLDNNQSLYTKSADFENLTCDTELQVLKDAALSAQRIMEQMLASQDEINLAQYIYTLVSSLETNALIKICSKSKCILADEKLKNDIVAIENEAAKLILDGLNPDCAYIQTLKTCYIDRCAQLTKEIAKHIEMLVKVKGNDAAKRQQEIYRHDIKDLEKDIIARPNYKWFAEFKIEMMKIFLLYVDYSQLWYGDEQDFITIKVGKLFASSKKIIDLMPDEQVLINLSLLDSRQQFVKYIAKWVLQRSEDVSYYITTNPKPSSSLNEAGTLDINNVFKRLADKVAERKAQYQTVAYLELSERAAMLNSWKHYLTSTELKLLLQRISNWQLHLSGDNLSIVMKCKLQLEKTYIDKLSHDELMDYYDFIMSQFERLELSGGYRSKEYLNDNVHRTQEDRDREVITRHDQALSNYAFSRLSAINPDWYSVNYTFVYDPNSQPNSRACYSFTPAFDSRIATQEPFEEELISCPVSFESGSPETSPITADETSTAFSEEYDVDEELAEINGAEELYDQGHSRVRSDSPAIF